MDTFAFPLPVRPKLPMGRRGSQGRRLLSEADSSPVSWRKYWTDCQDFKVPCSPDGGNSNSGGAGEDVFRVYRRGDSGPLLVLLHGGGYNALTWSLMVEELCASVAECQILAYDQRSHGSTHTLQQTDMSARTLANDVGRVLDAVYGANNCPGPVVLIGHSMGGAVAVHAQTNDTVGPGVSAIVVVDVVEGTALAALSSMHGVLAARPSSFATLQDAILWSYRSGQTRNLDAARVSMPGQVKRCDTGACAADEVQHSTDNTTTTTATTSSSGISGGATNSSSSDTFPAGGGLTRRRPSCRRLSVDTESAIQEEEEEVEGEGDKKQQHTLLYSQSVANRLAQATPSTPLYTWTTDLSSSSPHWEGWFEGLSQRFLSIPQPKLLLLAGVDRLDTDLTVGQMQGKFQLQVVGRCGHAVHEDAPEEVGAAVVAFLARHRLLRPLHAQDAHPLLPGC